MPFPLSDHCDGELFFNPGQFFNSGSEPRRGLGQVLRWRLSGKRAVWPPQPANPPYPAPPVSVDADEIAVTFIGHATFLVRFGGLTILTDPIFSERCSPVSWAGPKRARAPGVALRDLPPVDLILLSHNHYDHLDLPSLRQLHAPVVTMLGNQKLLAKAGLREVTELDWWGETGFDGLGITATPARHFSARTPFDRNRALWGGFMLQAGGKRLLFAGDSGWGPHWAMIGERLGAPDVALLPIGAYDPRWLMAPVHTNPEEAVQAHLALGAKQSIGMHFGTFQLTDEAIDEPVARLKQAGLGEAFVTLGFGETKRFK